ncbi:MULTISPECIES: HlyD family type I secretion periplasmic adaptor subunit [unclassified Bradyrhizobium]|uniref:HlyD family type I secretion periplasmic adaptor subunit n=1 Tax=unclassified Bradyrhizobium TaxID=2631580 RepID=UPI0024787739|nr:MULTISPECIES: HlyD family type I secretion periplasmic adaptor subunit [unclassified Bradyrhizobium]WGR73416.1 HlyD family type I secretion periplasmic adaptor subunit [Bradyrhizobium sp. ISRA426]WGR78253.1 HlyD family type I secretion periplasmic adaptor subunit [Bradyrhizobium sp. ISRA430]WGR88654.1 HlyD family type I secretion periplasmic adaptor subunit [Bradyrhizobium sp. ISRA432]
MGRVIDFCLVQFGLKSPAAEEGIARDEIPIAPHQAGHSLVSHHALAMDLTKPAPAIGIPQLKLSPSLTPAKTVERLLRVGGTSLVAGASFLLGRNRHDGAIDAADASLVVRAGRSYENELRTGLRVLLIVAILGGGWLALAPLAGAVVVPGNLVVQSNVKSIQHPTGGVVAEIKVADGARVAAGDLLLRLDATQVQASLQIVNKQLDEARARIARLIAERDGLAQVEFPAVLTARAGDADVRGLLNSETSLFKARSEGRASQKNLLQSKIAQLSQEASGLEAQVASKVKQLDLIAGELTGVQDLYDKRLVPLARLTTLQRETARIEGERGQLISSIAETKSKVDENQLQIARLDQDFRTDVVKELGETQGKEAELIQRGVSAQDQLDRIELRAPTSGTIHQLSVHTIGGVIRPGDVIMQLVPDADDLLVEAKLQPHDIDQVRPGQQAFVRFSAFNQRTTPQLAGTVSLISADISHDSQTNASYYSVRVVLPDDERRRLGGLQLVPGMPAEVFMQTGSRTMMSYLLKPITEQFNRAFVER